MAQNVSELETDGLISRRPDPSDGRRALLELTDEGRRILKADRQQREGWLIQAMAESFSEQERQALAQAVPLLARLADS
jgi:DNA-binding MarR family transcriptional regulator